MEEKKTLVIGNLDQFTDAFSVISSDQCQKERGKLTCTLLRLLCAYTPFYNWTEKVTLRLLNYFQSCVCAAWLTLNFPCNPGHVYW